MSLLSCAVYWLMERVYRLREVRANLTRARDRGIVGLSEKSRERTSHASLLHRRPRRIPRRTGVLDPHRLHRHVVRLPQGRFRRLLGLPSLHVPRGYLSPRGIRLDPAPAQPHRGLTAACSVCTLVAHSNSTERRKHVFMEPDRTDVRRMVRHLPSVGPDLDLLATAVR